MRHDLIKTGDPDVFPAILDRNGEVALRYCRRCRKGEGELGPECSLRERVRAMAAQFRYEQNQADENGERSPFNERNIEEAFKLLEELTS